MSNKKNLLIYAHYYIPDTASTGQILRELAEGMLDKFNITVICVVPSYLGTIEEKYKTQKYYEEEINGVKVLRIRVPEFSKTNKKSRVKNILSYFFGAMGATFKVGKMDYVFSISQPPILGGLLGVWGKWMKHAKYIYNIQDFNPEQVFGSKYFEALKALGDRAAVSSANLVLMGIEPTYPSEKYGYIIPIGKEQVGKVSMFKEKPTQEVAKDYIAKGALWNGGVFAFKLGYVLNRAHELIDFVDYDDLFNKYDTLNKISFDYAVVEHESEIEVMRFAGTWKDLGTWNTLTEAMDSHAVGEALFNEKCENVHVVNELDVPILCMGLKDVVVSASPEGILVSDKEQSSYIKPYVNTLDHRVMFAEKSWGSFKVIDIDKASMAIKVTLNAGHQMNYHSHQHRDEVWTVIAGKGKTIVDGMEQNVKAGDVITMSAGCRHTVIAETELKLIEVQLGEAIDVHDKQKFELEY